MTILAALSLVLAAQSVEHTFRYQADRPLERVFVAGTFNNWQANADPMTVGADGRTWTRTYALPPGRHEYKFVLNGTEWITDPKAQRNEDDGNGNVNSVLMLALPGYDRPAAKGDRVLATSALAHETRVPDLNWDRGRLTLTLRARPDDLESVSVVLEGKRIAMREVSRDDLYAKFRAQVPWDRKSPLRYTFELKDGKTFAFGRTGLGQTVQPFVIDPKTYAPLVVPAWVESSVIYQIFPDRFENGDKRNDPANVMPWDGRPTYANRFGGDAAGVRKRLNHLESLGVGAVYFNPIFKGPSNHRYETTNYFEVDPQFGTNAEFTSLTKEMERRGIRTVLDGVFNHTAVDFFAFKDLRERGEASAFKDWYYVQGFPIRVGENPNYTAWWGYPSMPKVNLDNPNARSFMLEVPGFWHQEARIHGWRLDVANEVPMPFWRDFRKVVKGLDPNLWIVGEVWTDGSAWLRGDQWDSVMNYRFRDAVLRFLAQGSDSPSQFMGRLMRVYHDYAPQASRNMMNLLSSHDTPRFLTLANDDERAAMLAATIQFTWVGSPNVYYGEELGMKGGADPANRTGMEWNRATDDNAFLKHYRMLGRLRNSTPVLHSGEPVPLASDDAAGTLAYARVEGDAVALVAVNRSKEARTVTVPLNAVPAAQSLRFESRLGVAQPTRVGSSLRLSLPPQSAEVLTPTRSAAPRRTNSVRTRGLPSHQVTHP